MTSTGMDQKFQQFKKIAYKIAANLAEKFHLQYEELAQEGIYWLNQIYSDWDRHFNGEKSKESSWVYQSIYWHLFDFCLDQKKHGINFSVIETDEFKIDPPARSDWFGRLLTEISEEAKALVGIIVDAPKEIAEDINIRSPKRAQEAIKSYLIDYEDWSISKFYEKWREVQAAL